MTGRKGAAAFTALVLVCCLVGCGRKAAPGASAGAPATGPQATAAAINDADVSNLPAPATGPPVDRYDPAIVKLQVLLDRARFSPGVIDGRPNENVRRAVLAFEQANGLKGDGTPDKRVWDRLTKADPRPVVSGYLVDADDVAGPFTPDIPQDFPGQAALEMMGYRTPAEELAESFHMSVDLLKSLNPGADFRAGSKILIVDRGGDDLGTDIGAVEVDRTAGEVRAYGTNGKLLSAYPASIGSKASCPAIAGRLVVRSVIAQPTYSYQSDSPGVLATVRGRTEIAPGPNNPIGPVWIDLSRDGYGIHGAPDPGDVGKPQARGCVRLTSWDARELARGVTPGTPVTFK